MDTPIETYMELDYPHDHLNYTVYKRRLDILYALERETIANYSRSLPSQSGYYDHCFDSFVPLSDNQSQAFLESNRPNVFLGVKRFDQGECEGCATKNPTRVSTEWKRIRKFVGNREVFDIVTNDNARYPPVGAPFEVTAVTVGSSSRLFMLPQILSRWPGRYVFVISVSNDTQQKTVDFLGSLRLPDRMTTIVYTVESSIFPINYLRNLGIRNIETSHFMILDMDLLLSRNLHSQLEKLPNWLKESRRSAIIIPLFFFDRNKFLPYCSLLEDCLPLNIPLIPNNKTELIQCLNSTVCQMRKQYPRTHLYVMPPWFGAPKESVVSQLDCTFVDFQEPYVILKYTPLTPLFYEQFVNYGYNKVQFVEHLRAANYNFFILNHAFMNDLAHADSVYRSDYQSRGYLSMRNVYMEFQQILDRDYSFEDRFPVCNQSSFINVLTPL